MSKLPHMRLLYGGADPVTCETGFTFNTEKNKCCAVNADSCPSKKLEADNCGCAPAASSCQTGYVFNTEKNKCCVEKVENCASGKLDADGCDCVPYTKTSCESGLVFNAEKNKCCVPNAESCESGALDEEGCGCAPKSIDWVMWGSVIGASVCAIVCCIIVVVIIVNRQKQKYALYDAIGSLNDPLLPNGTPRYPPATMRKTMRSTVPITYQQSTSQFPEIYNPVLR